jgi:hypothetical protein
MHAEYYIPILPTTNRHNMKQQEKEQCESNYWLANH